MNAALPLRKAVLAVLVYIECENHLLMLYRNAKENDTHKGKWNGLGGKLEPNESMLDCAVREVREESGVELPRELFVPMGTLQFPLFKPQKNEDWIVFVFKAKLEGPRSVYPFSKNCPEGELHWIERNKVLDLNLWEGDRYFLPYVLEEKPHANSFFGTFWYIDGKLERHWITSTAAQL